MCLTLAKAETPSLMSRQHLTESPEIQKQRSVRREVTADAPRPGRCGSPSPLVQLQRTLGNQRVTQLIQTKRLTPEGKILGFQRKLTVGAADDQLEQEADRVSSQVVSMPDSVALAALQPAPPAKGEPDYRHSVQSKPLPLAASITPFAQRATRKADNREEEKEKDKTDEAVQAKRVNDPVFLPLQRQQVSEKKEEEPVQAKLLSGTTVEALQRQATAQEEDRDSIQAKSAATLAGSFDAGEEVESRLSQSKGGGSPLPDPVRAYMEPRFGVDFSHVRVHTDSSAIQMNRDIAAQAFTHGSDIYYGAGSSPTNLELTAHELTHVVQQTGVVPLQMKKQASPIALGPEPSEPSVQRACAPCAAGSTPCSTCASDKPEVAQRRVSKGAPLRMTWELPAHEQEGDHVAQRVLRSQDAVVSNSVQQVIAPAEGDRNQMLQTKLLAISITPMAQRRWKKDEEHENAPIRQLPTMPLQRLSVIGGISTFDPARTDVPMQDMTPPTIEGTAVQRKPLTAEEPVVDLTSERFRDDPRLQAAFDNAPPIRFGDRGEAVRKIQQTLVDLGFEMPVSTKQGTQEPDGIFGPETFRTVKAFQHMQGITKDGIVGRQTLGELEGRIIGRVATGTPPPFTVPPGGPISVTAVDRSPQRFEPCAGGFGQFHWEVAWQTNARNGYIVQEMESAQEGTFCDGTSDSGVAPAAPLFWEAWRVQQDGKVHPPPGTDTWQVPVHPAHRGTWQLTGRVFFVEQLDPDAGFRTGNPDAPQAGTLYATGVEPKNLGPVLLSRQAAGRWECCADVNVHKPLEGSGEPPSGTLTESEVGEVPSKVLSEMPSSGGAFEGIQAFIGPAGTCPPGYTQCDFIDHHISVPGQFALYELYKRDGEECGNALAMLSAVRSQLVQGVYKADEQKPAMMAIRHGTTWWELVPVGQGAVVFDAESPPMVVFRKNLASDRKTLATALNDAWNASDVGQLSIVIVPPSLKPCPLIPPPPPPPPPTPEPERECPPGMIPDPSGEFCLLPGEVVPPCTDKEMDQAFEKQKEFCASVKIGLDLACQLGTGPCEIGGTVGKFICDTYERIFGKPLPATKPPECSESNATFYEKCIVGTMVGERPNMSCSPGTAGKIRDKYRQWPGRVK